MMDAAQGFLREGLRARLHDLLLAQELAAKALNERRLPSMQDVPESVAFTVAATALLSNIVLVLLTAQGRKAVRDVVDTGLAIVLLVLLLAIVLGLPIGAPASQTPGSSRAVQIPAITSSIPRPAPTRARAGIVFLSLKALSYLVGRALTLPAVAAFLEALRTKLGV